MIEGVRITPLRRIPDDRGCIYHMLRSDDDHFEQFGEIYFSMIHPGVVKAWHLHKEMTLNYAVIVGTIKLVLFDDRPASATRGELQEIYVGEQGIRPGDRAARHMERFPGRRRPEGYRRELCHASPPA